MSLNISTRSVLKTWKGQLTMDGAGVRLKRVFGFGETPSLDPFLLLDAFGSDQPDDYTRGFPWHPHRGIETITYLLDGQVEHQDSLGNSGVIAPGDIQWMTAGGGILHQEMPKGDARGHMWGFQLWSNLPAYGKMMAPRYQEVASKQIPQVKTPEGALVRVIAGEVLGTCGPVKEILTDPEFLDISLPSAQTWTRHVKLGRTLFAYVIEGSARFDPNPASPVYESGTMILFDRGPSERMVVMAEKQNVRFLIVSGNPLNEPIAWRGPIVMNTQEELNFAFRELQEGTFVKRPKNQ